MPLTSMTGFADRPGGGDDLAWTWEGRSVNGRGLDLRLRLPEGFEALEAPLRAAAGRALARGSVTIGLRIGQGSRGSAPRLNGVALLAAIEAARAAGEAASARGLDLAPMNAADLLALRGVLEADARLPSDDPEVMAALAAEAEALVEALAAARRSEGAALARILGAQVDRIAELAAAARIAAKARGPRQVEALRARLEAVLAATAAVDEARLAQELALIAVRADVTEELDRLSSTARPTPCARRRRLRN